MYDLLVFSVGYDTFSSQGKAEPFTKRIHLLPFSQGATEPVQSKHHAAKHGSHMRESHHSSGNLQVT